MGPGDTPEVSEQGKVFLRAGFTESTIIWYDGTWYDIIHLLTAIGLTPGGSGTVHIYTQTIYKTTQLTTEQYN